MRTENRTNVKSKREIEIKQQKHIILLILTIMIIVCGCLAGSILSSAHGNSAEEPIYYTYYTEQEVVYGDSLWSIAAEIDMNNMTTKEIVKELKSINQLTGDAIYAGDTLIVPYTSTEFK